MTLRLFRPRTLGLAALLVGLFAASTGAPGVAIVALSVCGLAGIAAYLLVSGSTISWVGVALLLCIIGLTVGRPGLDTNQSHVGRPSIGGDSGIANWGPVSSIRERAENALNPGLPTQVAALLSGMALGDASRLDARVRDQFRRASLTHIVAASGQNVALLVALTIPLLGLFGLRLRARLVVCAGLIALYVPLAGAQAPIQRAAIMGLAALVASARGNRGHSFHALLVAAAATVAIDPSSPRQLGWQLSFAAVIGMMILADPIATALRAIRINSVVADAAGATVSATLFTAPLIAMVVGRLSLVAIPANLVAGVAVAPIMWLGLIGAAVGQLSLTAAAPFAYAAALPVAFVLKVAELASSPNWAVVGWQPTTGQVALVLAILVLFALLVGRRFQAGRPREIHLPKLRIRPARGRIVAIVAAVSAAIVTVVLVGKPQSTSAISRSGPRVGFLDVGQGDAELLADQGTGLLVDCGPPNSGVVSAITEVGVSRLSAVLLTHGQLDHVGGLSEVVNRFHPQLILDGTSIAGGSQSAEVGRILATSRARIVRPVAGTVVRQGNLSLTIVAPQDSAASSDPTAVNDRSVVAVADVGRLRVLLTADAESPTLLPIGLQQVDVLKVAHHGSADPGLNELLSTVRPRLAVIEVGEGNPYGHPVRSTLESLSAVSDLLRTDRDGTVVVRARSGEVEFERLSRGRL